MTDQSSHVFSDASEDAYAGHILEIWSSIRYWPERVLFLKKRAPKISPPYSIPFLSVLHQNKALHNFRKRVQPSIVKGNIGLEYALLRSVMYEGNIYEDGSVSVSFIASKSKVAPLNAHSTPRLELLGAILGLHL